MEEWEGKHEEQRLREGERKGDMDGGKEKGRKEGMEKRI